MERVRKFQDLIVWQKAMELFVFVAKDDKIIKMFIEIDRVH